MNSSQNVSGLPCETPHSVTRDLTPPNSDADEAKSAPAWWRLAAQIGAEVAQPLSRALDRVAAAADSGRIEGDDLLRLRAEIERARDVGMLSQRLARLVAGLPRQSDERLDLFATLAAAWAERPEAGDIALEPCAEPVEVLVDPALLLALFDALFDWMDASTHTDVALRVDLKRWPAHGRIVCGFVHGHAAPEALDNLAWLVLVRLAHRMGLTLRRHCEAERVDVRIEFPRTVAHEALEGLSTIEIDRGDPFSTAARPLAGTHVLVVAGRREVRAESRRALADMGLVLDFVGSVDAAAAFCRDDLPHAVVVEAALRGDRFDRLTDALRRAMPGLAIVEIAEEGHGFEVSGFNGLQHARIGREGLPHSLPSALVFELSKAA